MSYHSECVIPDVAKTGYVSASHKILKMCSHKAVETLLFLSSYTVLYAVFFFLDIFGFVVILLNCPLIYARINLIDFLNFLQRCLKTTKSCVHIGE